MKRAQNVNCLTKEINASKKMGGGEGERNRIYPKSQILVRCWLYFKHLEKKKRENISASGKNCNRKIKSVHLSLSREISFPGKFNLNVGALEKPRTELKFKAL